MTLYIINHFFAFFFNIVVFHWNRVWGIYSILCRLTDKYLEIEYGEEKSSVIDSGD